MDPDTGMWFPLVGADLDRMLSLREVAVKLAARSGKPLRLVRYSTRTEMEIIEPTEAFRTPRKAQEPAPAPTEAPEPEEPASHLSASYQTFDEPVVQQGLVHAKGVVVYGTVSDGEPGMAISFMVEGDILPPIVVAGKVATDLLSLGADALKAAKRMMN